MVLVTAGEGSDQNLSRKEHPHRDLSTTLRFGRDDKGVPVLPGRVVAEQKPFFIALGGPPGP